MEEGNPIRKQEEGAVRRKRGPLPVVSGREAQRPIHELEVRQIELEMQNAELRKAQAALEASRNRYSDLYDFAPVGYFTFDEKGLILDANLTGTDQLGIERDRLSQRPFYLYIAQEDRDRFRIHLSTVFRSKRRRILELRLKKKDGLFWTRLESISIEDAQGQRRCRSVISDITERKQAEEVLRETNQALRALIQASPLAIYTIDLMGQVKSWNPAAERIFGWGEQEVIGFPIPFIPPDKQDEFRALLARVLQGESFTGMELRRQKKDGSLIDISVSVAHLRDAEGSVSGIIGIAEDITERKQTEAAVKEVNEALQQKNREIEEANQARKKFFSYISHELKTPLNSIVGFTQLLRNGTYGPLSRAQSRALGLVYKNTEELLRLINNILDLARIESGKLALQMIETNLSELVDKVSLIFEPFIQERGLFLEKKTGSLSPRIWKTDPIKIRSILTNLLSNAIKFTEKGVIEIALHPLPNQRGIQMVVSDTGIGITAEHLETIFEEYQQRYVAREAAAEYSGGTGLGLAIVKKMVSSLHGKIQVKSTSGKGTKFIIDIPAEPFP